MSKLNDAKVKYDNIEIPEELNFVVQKAIKEANPMKKNTRKKINPVQKFGIGAAAAALLFTGSVNISPAFAQSMANIPVLNSIIKVITIDELTDGNDNSQAKISTPKITGLENKELEQTLNAKYEQENAKLYLQFQKDMAAIKEQGGGHLGVDSGYTILTDTDALLSISRYTVETQASSYETLHNDTIDKKNELLITLPSLFKDNAYISSISAYIKVEMHKQMAADDSKSYFIAGEEEVDGGFDKISPNQNFSITKDHELIIYFNEYDVAPGSMGTVQFKIPTSIIQKDLISNYYIK
ncbi:DUF3298 domain-containing protein [Viridibacillus sp. YIM B01967]|uniref:DUF3298 domain-containing protein n=1 Tax=Viridibacillus soli TaxID=2798301 RepID=A0ABS1H5C8_9BACL|nr:RsiV family protein [Viridibacillus soli]MBK3494606.1 DUF3298 domain-containing protein [Viridibacillus soli]